MDRELSRGVRAGVAAYLLWGFLTVYWKQLTGLDAFEMIGWRMALTAVVMAIVVTLRRRWTVLRTALSDHRLALRLLAAGVLLATNWTMYVWAVVSDHVLETALGYFLAPLGTIAVGVMVLGETLTPLRRLAAALAVVAVAVLTASYGRLPFVAIVIATSWTLYALAKRRVPLTPIESLAGETFVLVLPAIGVIAWGALRSDGVPATASGADWMYLAGTGIVTALPLVLFAFAAQRVPFTLLGPLNYLVPLINFLLGWLVYGEDLPPTRVAGFVLVWFALVAVTVDTVRSTRRARVEAAPAALV